MRELARKTVIWIRMNTVEFENKGAFLFRFFVSDVLSQAKERIQQIMFLEQATYFSPYYGWCCGID